jgi:hypothetical protein
MARGWEVGGLTSKFGSGGIEEVNVRFGSERANGKETWQK